MSFFVLPPEVTSAQLFSGAGSQPLWVAAATWESLSSELSTAAQSFSSVTSNVPWQGAAAAAMTAVASQYSQWLSAASNHAGSTAANAKATAGIFESAKAAITHPTAVAINRTQLVQLVRSNLLGLNAPAIAAVESQYEAMWANNVATLVGYHSAASSVAAQLTPWQQALQSLQSLNPAAAMRRSPLQQIISNNQGDVAAMESFVGNQVAGTQALTRSELGAAGQALASGNLVGAAQDVGEAGLLNAGTTLRLETRLAGFPLQVAGEDLNILGGLSVPLSPPNATSPALSSGGGLLSQLTANNQGAVARLLDLNQNQLADVQAATRSDLAAAGAALGSGNILGAARDVVDAGLINAGTGLEVGGRTGFFAPLVAGQDLTIAGGGASLLGGMVINPAATSAFVQESPWHAVAVNNQQAFVNLQDTIGQQLANTQALTRTDLAAAGTALLSGNLGGFVHNVGDAELINVGQTLRIGSDLGDFPLQVAGQDLNILGGSNIAKFVTNDTLPAPGSHGLLSDLLNNNNGDQNSLLSVNSNQLADAQYSTRIDLAAAGAALGKGDLFTAAKDVADAGLVNAGTTLEVGGRTAFFAPEVAGEDLDILGGGASLIGAPAKAEVALQALVAPGNGLLGQVAQYNHEALTNLQENITGQLSSTQALSRSDLTAAGQAFLSGHPVTAAHDLIDADLINAGTTLRIGTEVGSFAPNTLGEDLNILGGNGPAMQRLAAVMPGGNSLLEQVAQYNHNAVTNLQDTISSQLSATQALTRSDLTAAGHAFVTGNFGAAAHELADAELINAGTTTRIGAEIGDFYPNTAGEDLLILGGGAGGMRLNTTFATLIGSGNGGALANVLSNNNIDTDNLIRTNASQLSYTQALARSDLAAAGAALGNGDLFTAAKDVADAELINAGTTLQVGGRTAFFTPQVAGQDLDIFGGGSSLLNRVVNFSPLNDVTNAMLRQTGLLENLVNNNYSDVSNVLSLNSYQISATQALTRTDLFSAGSALATGNFLSAGHDLVNAELINVGSGLDVAGRTAGLFPQVIGEDIDLIGGGGSYLWTQPQAYALAGPVANGHLIAEAQANNRSDLLAVERENAYQTTQTQALVREDLGGEVRDEAFSGSGAAVPPRHIVDAGLVTTGSTVDEAGRTATLAPTAAGEDLDILGGGERVIPDRVLAEK